MGMAPVVRMSGIAVVLLCVWMISALPQSESGRVKREPWGFNVGALPSSWQINPTYTSAIEQARAMIQSRGMRACRMVFAGWICDTAAYHQYNIIYILLLRSKWWRP